MTKSRSRAARPWACADRAARPWLSSGIGGRDELRRDFRRGAEGGIVERRQILLHGVAGRGRIALLAPLGIGDRPALVGVGFNEARIDGKALTADETRRDAGEHDPLEDVAQHIAVPEAPMPVLGERRVVGHLVVEVQAAEPAERQPVRDLLAQPPLEQMP